MTVGSFSIGASEVTQAQYTRVMGTNPSRFKGDNLPVVSVSWYDAVAFCNKLSLAEKWTPAYMVSGTNVTWNRSANGYRLPTGAEWEFAAKGGTQARGTTYAGSNSPGGQSDPAGPTSGTDRVERGGSWSYAASDLRSTYRFYNTPDYRNINLGFRVVAPSVR